MSTDNPSDTASEPTSGSASQTNPVTGQAAGHSPAPGVRSVNDIVSSGTNDPLSDEEIQHLRGEINRLDAIILDAIQRRSEISRRIGLTRMGSGGTRLVHTREVAIINEFRDRLGPEGPAIAGALLRMGRGRLG